MQATSTAVRQEQVRQTIETGSTSLRTGCSRLTFTARQAQVAALAEIILRDGQPELHGDSTSLSSHFKLRRGFLPAEGGGMNPVEALVYTHRAGYVLRLWVYGGDFSVKVRDVILLPDVRLDAPAGPPSGEAKGFDVWLDTRGDTDGGRLFPHSGKYLMPGLKILSHCLLGR